jgi:hypothetical protein
MAREPLDAGLEGVMSDTWGSYSHRLLRIGQPD